MILFLTVLQIAVSALLHGYAVNNLQGSLSRTALLGSQTQDLPGGASSNSQSISRTPLAGGGYLLTGSLVTNLPVITPLLPFTQYLRTQSMVVDENP
jgi:hypothetical protein